jgi:hypothetical protein
VVVLEQLGGQRHHERKSARQNNDILSSCFELPPQKVISISMLFFSFFLLPLPLSLLHPLFQIPYSFPLLLFFPYSSSLPREERREKREERREKREERREKREERREKRRERKREEERRERERRREERGREKRKHGARVGREERVIRRKSKRMRG